MKVYSKKELMKMFGFAEYWLDKDEQKLIEEYRTEKSWNGYAKETEKENSIQES